MSVTFVSCSQNGGTTPDDNSADKTVSASAEQSSEEETTQIKLTEYKTDYGVISYPEQYKDTVKISENNDDGNEDLTFSTEIDGVSYELFSVVITDDAERNDGVIHDKDGNEHYVTVSMSEIDVSNLNDEQQNTLFSMQEMVNDIVENLE